jgi:tetratricopeptide (TPR) repeat protein/DNA-binding winged helix-turn-helix (wHTH) protein/TolB-like protein
MSARRSVPPEEYGSGPANSRGNAELVPKVDDTRVLECGPVSIDLAAEVVLRDGREERLAQKSFQVLRYLARERHRIVTKEELLAAAWPDVVVTEDSLVQCIVEIRRALGDDARHPRFIRTVPKRGYRFIGEISARPPAASSVTFEESTSVEVEVIEEQSGPVRRPTPRRRRLLAAGAVAAAVALGVAGVRQARREPALAAARVPGRTSVAVLFFENRAASERLDWLREGLTDMVITDLSRGSRLSVLSRSELRSLLARRGARSGEPLSLEDALDIARRADADAIVLGSFTAVGEELRVDAQIHDAHGGRLVAAERLTLAKADEVLSSIGLLSAKLAERLGAPTPGPEERGLGDLMTSSLEAYRAYSIALEKAEGYKNGEAVELLERAVALDPAFAMAWARIGWGHTMLFGDPLRGRPYLEKAYGLSSGLGEHDRLSIVAWYAVASFDFTRAIAAYRRLLAAYPLDGDAYVRLAALLATEGRPAEAERVLRRALEVDREDPDATNRLAGLLSGQGRHAEAIELGRRYVTLARADSKPNAHDTLGLVLAWSGRYEEAIAEYRTALAAGPRFELAARHLGNALAHLGRYREARAEYLRYLELAPSNGERAAAYEALAGLARRSADLDQAASLAAKVLEHEPSYFWMALTVAAERKDRAEVERLAPRLEAPPGRNARGVRMPSRPYVFARGVVALEAGHGDAAVRLFAEALRDWPMTYHLEPLEDCLARAYVALGRWREAAAECERLIRLNPNDALAHYRLGVAREGLGDARGARAEWKRFLELWKGADADVPELLGAKRKLSA